MIALARFSVAPARARDFQTSLDIAYQSLARCPGFICGEVGRNLDDPALWVLMTRWENVGSYRRALGSIEVKTLAVPVLAQAIDEPGAYQHEENF